MKTVQRFSFEPRTTAPMTLLRVGWGAVMVAWTLSLLADVDPFLTTGALRYDRPEPAGSWNPLDWISWSGAPLAACLLLLGAAVATMVGYRTRLSTVIAVVCLISIERTNTTILNSGDLFLRQIGIALALSPCGLLWSIDARRRGPSDPSARWRAPWAQRLLQLEVAVGYLLSAWAKIRGATWQDGSALARALRIEDLQRIAVPEWFFHSGPLSALTWATLVFEGSFILLVWNRRLRPWVLSVAGFSGSTDLRSAAAEEVPLAVEPAEQHCHRAWIVTQTVTGSADDPQLRRTVSIDENSGIEHRHEVVVAAVHHEQRTRAQLGRILDRTQIAQLPAPRIKVGGVDRLLDHPHLTCVIEQPPRVGRPIVEVGRCAHGSHAAHIRTGRPRTDRQGATCAEPREPHPADGRVCLEVRDSCQQVVQPASQREVAFGVPAATKGQGHRDPTHLRRDPIGQLWERGGSHSSRVHVAWIPVGENHGGDVRDVRAHRRPHQMGRQQVPI